MSEKPLPDAEVYVMTVPHLTDRFRVEIERNWRVEMPGKKLLILSDGMSIAPLSHLDAAWREAESIRSGWIVGRLTKSGATWFATAYGPTTGSRQQADGPTPTAALHALAVKLGDR